MLAEQGGQANPPCSRIAHVTSGARRAGGLTCSRVAHTGLIVPGKGGWCARRDRKSTRLNSSHGYISYAVFCLKKKKLEVKLEESCEVQRSEGLCGVYVLFASAVLVVL